MARAITQGVVPGVVPRGGGFVPVVSTFVSVVVVVVPPGVVTSVVFVDGGLFATADQADRGEKPRTRAEVSMRLIR